MAKYLKTAAKANDVITSIMGSLGEHPEKEYILSQLLYLYNLGIRTAPRATQSTVRLNAVKEAAKGQPVKISMVEREATGYRGPYTFKAINIETTSNNLSEEPDQD